MALSVSGEVLCEVISGSPGVSGVRSMTASPASRSGSWRCSSAQVTQSMDAISPAPRFTSISDWRWLPAERRLRKKLTAARQGSHFFSQRIVAGLGIRGITDRPASAKIRQRQVPILLAHRQKAAVLDPFAARCRVVKTADNLHVRKLGNQRITAGLAEDKPGLSPVGQQIGFRPAGIAIDGHTARSQQPLYRQPERAGIGAIHGIHGKRQQLRFKNSTRQNNPASLMTERASGSSAARCSKNDSDLGHRQRRIADGQHEPDG
ncbi:hypothetical protein L1887_42680 [Cichorium endivia]|nr:hypothetical protein L1887_42680 [Cichorium endivia]